MVLNGTCNCQVSIWGWVFASDTFYKELDVRNETPYAWGRHYELHDRDDEYTQETASATQGIRLSLWRLVCHRRCVGGSA